MTIDESYVVNVEGAIVRDGRYLLIVRSLEDTHAPGALALVGGKVENAGIVSDILEDTLRREVREEVGLELVEMAYLGSSAFVADDGDPVVDIVFLCRPAPGEPTPGDPAEVADLMWLTASEIRSRPDTPPWTLRSIKAAERVRSRLGW